MDWVAIEKRAEKLMKNRKAHRERERGFVYYHGKRVAAGAIELRKLLFPNDDSIDDLLRLAGMFHDLGKGLTPHALYGAALLPTALEGLAPEEMINKAADMISKHASKGEAAAEFDIPARLLQDADLLDHSGCYGVWMCAQYYGYFDGSLSDGVQFCKETSEKYYKDNVGLLNFEISKGILRDKINFEQEFFRRAAFEAEGRYFSTGEK